MKKNLKFILILIFLSSYLSNAQKYNYQIPFGYGNNVKAKFGISVLDFNNQIVKCYALSGVKNFEIGGNGTYICDQNGQLLMLTNNCDIRDKNFMIIENGDTLTPGFIWDNYCPESGDYPSWQDNILLPELSNDSVYYLIHQDANISDLYKTVITENIYLSTIIHKKDGKLILKDRKIIQNGVMSPNNLTATINSNKTKWWINTIDFNSNVFRLYEIGGKELISTPVISEIGIPIKNNETGFNQINYSSESKTLAINNRYDIGVLLYDFDNKTGKLSNFRKNLYHNYKESAEGACFSPNGRFLYLTAGRHIFQMDMKATNPSDSVVYMGEVSLPDEFNWPIGVGHVILGPDCRIYVSPGTTTHFIHVIHKPDEKFPSCDFEIKAIDAPTTLLYDFPYSINYYKNGGCDSTIKWGIPTNISSDLLKEPKLNIFPNPSITNIQVQLKMPNDNHIENAEILLVDRAGQLIQKQDFDEINIMDVSHLPNGIYFVQITQSINGIYRILAREKIVVIRE